MPAPQFVQAVQDARLERDLFALQDALEALQLRFRARKPARGSDLKEAMKLTTRASADVNKALAHVGKHREGSRDPNWG